LFVVGLRAWFPHRARDAATVALTSGLALLALLAPWVWIAPSYAQPETVARVPDDAAPLDLAFGDAIRLRGIRFPQETVHPGEPFPVDLYWETDRDLGREDEAVIWLRLLQEPPPGDDPAGGVLGLEDSYPGAGALPASLWPVDELLVGREYVWVGEDVAAPLVARLDVGLYDAESGELLTPPGGNLPTVGRVKVVPRRWPKPAQGSPWEWALPLARRAPVATFGHGVSLAEVGWQPHVGAGEELDVALTWIVGSAPERDYSVFLHLVDAGGKQWGGGDGAPRQNTYPTSRWESGEVVVDERTISVAADVPPGRYHLYAGWYDSGGRVAAFGAEGERLPNDALELGQVEVR
jgi:hypothetical protein